MAVTSLVCWNSLSRCAASAIFHYSVRGALLCFFLAQPLYSAFDFWPHRSLTLPVGPRGRSGEAEYGFTGLRNNSASRIRLSLWARVPLIYFWVSANFIELPPYIRCIVRNGNYANLTKFVQINRISIYGRNGPTHPTNNKAYVLNLLEIFHCLDLPRLPRLHRRWLPQGVLPIDKGW